MTPRVQPDLHRSMQSSLDEPVLRTPPRLPKKRHTASATPDCKAIGLTPPPKSPARPYTIRAGPRTRRSVDSDDDLEMGSPAPDLQGFSIKEQIKIVCAGDTGS